MYETIRVLEKKRVTPTAALILILARCCRCGEEREMLQQNAVRANKEGRKHCPSCRDETFHRMTDTRFWRIWKGMKARALDQNNPDYPRYGAAGRGVCEQWLTFETFYSDMFAGYRDDLTIERIDNSKGYSKENCRWATNAEQQANKNNNRVLTYLGREMHLAELCRLTGVGRCALSTRLNMGMGVEEALADYATSPYPKGRRPRG